MKNIKNLFTSVVLTPSGRSSQFTFAWLKNVLRLAAVFIGGLFFLMIVVVVFQMILFLITNDPLNQKVVDSGYPFETNEKLRQAAKKIGGKLV